MRRALIEHFWTVLVVFIAVGALILVLRSSEGADREAELVRIQQYLAIPFVDYDNPLDRALFHEALTIFSPTTPGANDSLITQLESYREARFTDPRLKAGASVRGLSWPTVQRIGGMYIEFLLVYAIVFLLTSYGAWAFGVFRYVAMKQGKESSGRAFLAQVRLLLAGGAGDGRAWGRAGFLLLETFVRGIAYLVLFSPAYVIGYALKTRLETDSILFMVLLGVISNGVLITAANRFFTILLSEGRKGYVEMAVTKGLISVYDWDVVGGIPRLLVFQPWKPLPRHVFSHIHLAARQQFLPALKEQGAILITGLIIIEMALNIQGRLCYEMLQRLLYQDYEVALVIMVGIFLCLKGTEIAVDVFTVRTRRRYENHG